MDIVSILVGLGIVVLLIATVIALIYILNKNSNDSSPLDRISEKYNLKLDKTEFSSSLLLALDSENHKLVVVEPKNHEQLLLIDLHKIGGCELKKLNSPEKNDRIYFISLNLMDRESGRTDEEIVFYDEFDIEKRNRFVQLQMAKRWRRYVEEVIKAGKD